MKNTLRLILASAMMFAVCLPVWAELQNIEVGGEIRIRGRYWMNVFEDQAGRAQRIPPQWLQGRAIGNTRGVVSRFDWSDEGADRKLIEQLTMLHFQADFTNEVKAVFSLESYDVWGEDFRSNYITGVDSRAVTDDDIEFGQAYIEAGNMWGMPLTARIGRQYITLGKGWLVNERYSGTRTTPFDGLRLTYGTDDFCVDAIYAKLFENGLAEEDGDIDFYALYGTYKGIEALQMSAYWMLVRDARSINDTNFSWFPEWLEDWFGVDNYDVTNLNTIGIRLYGESAGFDYDLEAAYQFGNASSTGQFYRKFLYGDDDAEHDGNWGMDAEVGYGFDMAWSPRVYLGGAYYSGEDNRDVNFWEWLSPFDKPEASVSFNRLFGGIDYTSLWDSDQLMSNFWQVRGGVEFKPTDTLSMEAQLAYFAAVDPFDYPVYVKFGRFRVPVAPALSFWTKEADEDLGWMTTLKAKYQYSEDLYFAVGWNHLFTGDGMSDGSFTYNMGQASMQGSDTDDADYFYWDTRIKF